MLSVLRNSPYQSKREQTSYLPGLGLSLIRRIVLILLLFQVLLQPYLPLQTSLLLRTLFRIFFPKTLEKSLYVLQVLLQFLYIICLIISLLFYQVFLLTCYSNSLVLNIFNFVFNYLVFFYQFQGDSQYVLRCRFQQ